MNGPLPVLPFHQKPNRFRCEKHVYSKVEAQTAYNARMRSRHNRPEHLRIYFCNSCQGWHLTSKAHYDED